MKAGVNSICVLPVLGAVTLPFASTGAGDHRSPVSIDSSTVIATESYNSIITDKPSGNPFSTYKSIRNSSSISMRSSSSGSSLTRKLSVVSDN